MSQHDAHVQYYYRLKLERMRAEAGLEAPVDKIGRRLFHLAVLDLKEERKAAAVETEEEKGYLSVEEFMGYSPDKPRKAPREDPSSFHLIASATPPDTGDSSVATIRNRLLNKMRGPIPLRGPEREHLADLLFARLHAAAPWMAELTEALWKEARVAAAPGRGLAFRPTLLVGPKGCGKSTYAAKLAHMAGVPFLRIDAASGLASFAVAGVEAGWRSAKPGSPISLMAEERVGNPIILIDEVDKCAQPDSVATLDQALLPLLEPGTAETWVCPFLGIKVDMSRINWLLAANDLGRVAEVLRDRTRVVEVGYPSGGTLASFIRSAAPEGVEPEVIEALIDLCTRAEVVGKPVSLRRIKAALEAADNAVVAHTLN